MGKIKKILESFKKNLPVWVCLVVYIWALEFQAIINLSQEPITDTIVDGAAVLLTLGLWGIAASLFVAISAAILLGSSGAYFSEVVCKGGMIVATGVYLARWLKRWSFLSQNRNVVVCLLFICCVALAIRVWQRYTSKQIRSVSTLPSLDDCFRFGALPILISAIIVVGGQVFRHSPRSVSVHAGQDRAIPKGHENKSPNVILILADALRARSMSLYGYHKSTTPYLEELGANSTVYKKAHSNSTATQISITTLISGKHPLNHGRLSFDQPPYQSEQNLLNILKKAGYTTAAVTNLWDASMYALGFSDFLSVKEQANFRLPTLHWLGGFGVRHTKTGSRMRDDLYDEIFRWLGFYRATEFYTPADANFESVRKILATLDTPFFLLIHVKEPHEPYLTPPRFRRIFGTQERDRPKQDSLIFNAYYPPKNQRIADTYKDRYDETIRFLDESLGNFIEFIYKSGLGKNLLLIITSDHGESFEHGYLGHGDDLHESSTHIPLIIKWPFQKLGKKITNPVQLIDIAPTILDALGLPVPEYMDGQSLRLETEVKPSDTVALNQQMGPDRTNLPNRLAIWSQHHKLILDCNTHETQLFDLSSDPNETTNDSSQEPFVVEDLMNRVETMLKGTDAGRQLLHCLPQEQRLHGG